MRFYLLIFSFSLLVGSVGAEPIKIVLAGDSTVATLLNPPKDRPRLSGWGQMLGEFMPGATVINHARSGTSTKSFRDLGLWERVSPHIAISHSAFKADDSVFAARILWKDWLR
jgi:lysophospholipase L1-like esterase